MWRDGLKWVKLGSKWTQFTRLCSQNRAGSFLETRGFDPFLAHFFGAKTAHFLGFKSPAQSVSGHRCLVSRGGGARCFVCVCLVCCSCGWCCWGCPV